MNAQNDPIRLRHALIRLAAAVLAAVLLLTVSGFGVFKLLRGSKSFAAIDEVQVGDYVEHKVYLNLGYCASGYHHGRITEKYAVIPVNGQMVAFCFPSRWFDSADTIQSVTSDLRNGKASTIDKYILVTGTVKAVPEAVSSQLYSWFGENKDWMEQSGLIGEVEDYADVLPDVMVYVDTVGSMSVGWVIALSVVAALCLIYAIIVLVRIARKKYGKPDITVEITEDSADVSEDGITVEITEEAVVQASEITAEESTEAPEPENEKESPETSTDASADASESNHEKESSEASADVSADASESNHEKESSENA